jgi:hypothetical protein
MSVGPLEFCFSLNWAFTQPSSGKAASVLG